MMHGAGIFNEETDMIFGQHCGQEVQGQMYCEEEDTSWSTDTNAPMVLSRICKVSARAASNDKNVTIFTNGDKFA